MKLRMSLALRIIFIVFFLFTEAMVIFLLNQFIRENTLGSQEIALLLAFGLGAFLFLVFTRMEIIIGDNYIEYFSALPGRQKVTIRAVDVDKIERSASPFQGRVDYIRMKSGKELYTIFTDSMERRKEIPALLEKALHTKIIE